MTKILMNTWRREAPTFGPVLRDQYGSEVQYVHAVQRAGAHVYLAPQSAAGTSADEVLDGFSGLVLIGGEDLAADTSGVDPSDVGSNARADRDRWELDLLDAALRRDLPVLAICRGLQMLNVALGGSLLGDIAETSAVHPKVPEGLEQALAYRHPVTVEPGSRLADIYGVPERQVNSLHHQAIDRLASDLQATARASDGVVEAVEHQRATWCVGVQWHPELLTYDAAEQRLFAEFVRAARTSGRHDGTSSASTAPTRRTRSSVHGRLTTNQERAT